MTDQNTQLLAFNRGVIDARGLARIDLERMSLSADTMTNWVPRVLGSMIFRPGLEFIDRTAQDNLYTARQIPFIFDIEDTAQIEMANVQMRVRIDDVLITRPSVATAVGNDSFDVGLSPWTDISDSPGGTVTTTSSGWVDIEGDGTDFGRIEQAVTVAGGDQNVEHALFVDIEYGKVLFKVGSTSGDDDYVQETRLGRGVHSLSFTPTGATFYIQIAHEREYRARINECSIEAAGDLSFTTPWAQEDLPFLRYAQSGDVIYVACKNASTTGVARNAEVLKKIERRGDGRSWSLVTYEPDDGPFRVQNVSGITMTPSALNGDITITASEPFFQSTRHANSDFGALIRIASSGQTVTVDASAENVFTDPIRVTGTGESRRFSFIIEGTFTATVTIQFSIGSDAGPWNDLTPQYTSIQSSSYLDEQDGQIIYYRIGVKAGDYSTGTVTTTLVYTSGSIQGIARIKGVSSSTVVTAQVLKDFGDLNASKDWWEGEWSYYRGFPTAVDIHEGRLWWAALGRSWGSISDEYESYDDNQIGDSGPISRSIGSGPHKVINWLMAMGRLLMGTSDTTANIAPVKIEGNNVLGARSNSFDEPLTPTNFNIKTIASKGIFVDRSEQRLYELSYNIDDQDYKSLDLSIFTPDFNIIGIKQIAVQMKPDLRIHCVRTDGTVGMLVFDRLENVICWCEIDSSGASGEIEDVSVLPGKEEDQVYYIVKRTINGGSQRHLCKWAKETEAVGGQLNKQADSFVSYTGVATTAPFTTELLHLRDETVVIWADGIDVGTQVVTSTGGLTSALATAASNVVVGLSYEGFFKSTKMATQDGIGLLETKKINRLGFIAQNMHYQGLQYGPDFTTLYDLPQVTDGVAQPVDTIYETYHEDDFPFGGEWDEDARLCLKATAPRPVTILAAIAEMQSVAKSTTRR